jgi:nitroreductase
MDLKYKKKVLLMAMVLDAILKRRAVREYRADTVSDSDIEEIIKAGQFAPTAMNNRMVEFVVVKDKGTKEKLFEIIDSRQEFLKTAPLLIIPVTDSKVVLPIPDLSIASENIMIQAASLGLGTVWKNLREPEARKVKEFLGIPETKVIINIIPVGYPKVHPTPHNDAEFSKNKIHHEKWG